MLADLLQPATPELARRWITALLLVPPHEREALVARIEARIVAAYAQYEQDDLDRPANQSGRGEHTRTDAEREIPIIQVVHPPVQRDGYVEQVIAEYAADRSSDPSADESASESGMEAHRPSDAPGRGRRRRA